MSKLKSMYSPKESTNAPSSLRMAQNQLLDSLTSHISLYNSHSDRIPVSKPNTKTRSLILKWFSSLSVHQRQAHLTTVDFMFTQLLVQMLGKLHARGHGCFIILPDLPSCDPPFLPGLCYKPSHGLLSRVAASNESEQLIFRSTRLFGSREGEKIEECSCSVRNLDSMTVNEEFVKNVDQFVGTMDAISNGAFLRGEETELGSDWVELEWLKAKGYYSIEAFVANRLEVALRLAWLNCTNGKKRGAKLKEKARNAGMAANVFWRKKGCVDWWMNLNDATRKKVLTTILGKAAKSLSLEILKAAGSASKEELWLFTTGVTQPIKYDYTDSLGQIVSKAPAGAEFGLYLKPDSLYGKHVSLANLLNCLFLLQDVINVVLLHQHSDYGAEKVFFSMLDSVSTTSDSILRKLRGFLMIISLDFTKQELLEGGNVMASSKKSKEKVRASDRQKKGRSRNVKGQNTSPGSGLDESTANKHLKDPGYSPYCNGKADLGSKAMFVDQLGNIINQETLPAAIMEHNHGVVSGKRRSTTRIRRKEKQKTKHSCFNSPVVIEGSQKLGPEDDSSSSRSQKCAVKFYEMSHNLNGVAVANAGSSPGSVLESTSGPCLSTDQPLTEEIALHMKAPDAISIEGSCQGHPSCRKSFHDTTDDQMVHSRRQYSNCSIECDVMSLAASKHDCVYNPEITKMGTYLSGSKTETKSAFSTMQAGVQGDGAVSQELDNKECYANLTTNYSHYLSYEWPTVPPICFPAINSHAPAATDRLHLDAGHNRHNQIRQSFVSTVHQRNPPIEGGCGQPLPCPVPMSLDWPPMVQSAPRLVPSVACNFDSGFISRSQSSLQKCVTSQKCHVNTNSLEDERKHSGERVDKTEPINAAGLADECDYHWISEEEREVQAVSDIDYNQYFGGGVMYWNPSDHPSTRFSRPPSLSSDDSSWAWHEADMSRVVDDMVAFSSSYSTNGLTSPTAASFCSPFDRVSPGSQALSYVVPGNDVSGKLLQSSSTAADVSKEEVPGSCPKFMTEVEGKIRDLLPYPLLRPIIVPNMSRERSGSDSKRGHDHKSPCVAPTKQEQHRVRRPPSPVVLCVTRAPCPPPSSSMSDSKKHRGFPTVRSGSSSPRNWGIRGFNHDGIDLGEGCVRTEGIEVVWPSWRSKNLSAHPIVQPHPGALLPDCLVAVSHLAQDQEHLDVSFPLQPLDSQNCPARKASLCLMHSLLNNEIDVFCNQVAAKNMDRKPYITWAVKRVTRSLQVLWPRSRTNVFGSNATGLSLPSSDVDLVVCLPPVRNLEPIKEAGILEGRNGIKETCLQHAARYLANQEWVKSDSLKTVENTAIPIIMLVVQVPDDLVTPATANVQKDEQTHENSGNDSHSCSGIAAVEDSSSPKSSQINWDVKLVRLDISFKSPSHTGLQTTELVKELTKQFPAVAPLALVLKQFLGDRSLDQSYSGGLSSYCLVLLITRFLQHEHHLGRSISQNLGSLLLDFLYFFGNVFDPRQMRISVQGSGIYLTRERDYSIDPIHIDDPLFPTNNVGRNCFRIHQCIKAFSEAYSTLENELACISISSGAAFNPLYRLLPKIIPSINFL